MKNKTWHDAAQGKAAEVEHSVMVVSLQNFGSISVMVRNMKTTNKTLMYPA